MRVWSAGRFLLRTVLTWKRILKTLISSWWALSAQSPRRFWVGSPEASIQPRLISWLTPCSQAILGSCSLCRFSWGYGRCLAWLVPTFWSPGSILPRNLFPIGYWGWELMGFDCRDMDCSPWRLWHPSWTPSTPQSFVWSRWFVSCTRLLDFLWLVESSTLS